MRISTCGINSVPWRLKEIEDEEEEEDFKSRFSLVPARTVALRFLAGMGISFSLPNTETKDSNLAQAL